MCVIFLFTWDDIKGESTLLGKTDLCVQAYYLNCTNLYNAYFRYFHVAMPWNQIVFPAILFKLDETEEGFKLRQVNDRECLSNGCSRYIRVQNGGPYINFVLLLCELLNELKHCDDAMAVMHKLLCTFWPMVLPEYIH